MVEDQTSVQAAPHGNTSRSTFSLNSKRLTTVYIHQLAVALEIPTRASAADILRMFEGKIAEDGREPADVQVVVKEGEGGVDEIWLKLGGDKGGGYFKMNFQIVNTPAPNSVHNICVFSCFEASDTLSNLHVALDKFRGEVANICTMKWK